MDNRIFITSDLHFCHNKPFLYEPRGFSSIEEHDVAIVQKWNSIVEEDDTVYMLGDAMLNDNVRGVELFKQLNGKIHYIIGNHDSDNRLYNMGVQCENIIDFSYAARLKHGKYHFYLSHYPTLTANADDGKYLAQHVINLCGHSHTKNPFTDWDKGLIYHCELDAHNCKPVLLDSIINDIKEKWKEKNEVAHWIGGHDHAYECSNCHLSNVDEPLLICPKCHYRMIGEK